MSSSPSQLTEQRAKLITPLEILFGLLLFTILVLVERQNYLLFHTLAEFFSIIVAAGIFMVSLNTRSVNGSSYLSFIGLAFFFIALVDLFHTLVFPGIGLTNLPQPTNISIQFWLLARYIEAAALLISPLFIHKKLPYGLIFSIFLSLTGALCWVILETNWFPTSYIEGSGLTPFKIFSEYLICFLLLSAVGVLKKQEDHFDADIFKLIIIAILLKVVSELAFTLYETPTSLPNVIGHYLKVISFFFIYKAIISQSLQKPLSLIFKDLKIKETALSQAKEELEGKVLERTSELKQINNNLEREAAERKEVESALRESQIKLSSIINTMPDMIFIINHEGIFLDFAGSKELLILPPDQFLGKSVKDTLPPYLANELSGHLLRCLLSQEPISFEYELPLAEKLHYFEARLIALDDQRAMAIIRDISDYKRSEAALIDAKNEAEQANKSKSNFLAAMSHELRTPMNGVLGMTQLLLHSKLDEEQESFLNVINQSGEALVKVLNDILDITKIEAHKIQSENETFSLDQLLSNFLKLFSSSAKAKGLKLSYSIDPEINHNCIGDENLIRQVLSNLIANAIKFSDVGSVTIKLNLAERHNSNQSITFEVIDTGIGIPKDQHRNIFASFSQVDGSSTRKHGGSGLGLTIVSKLVDIMGGKVELESSPGQGSRFYFTLLLPASSTIPQNMYSREMRQQDELVQAHSGGAQILVVEDDEINQTVAMNFLNNLGYQAELAINGQDALEKLSKHPYELIFMDCLMPIMDGYEATEEIRRIERESPEKRHIPIVALTAKAMYGDRKKCLDSGMDDYIPKPLQLPALQEALDRWLVSEKS